MKMTQLKKLLSVILCTVLIAATALFAIGCSNEGNENPETPKTEDVGKTDAGNEEDDAPATGDTTSDGVTEIGEGERSFSFTVVELDGKETKFLVKTNKQKVGDALLEVKLIEGEAGPYGLYVKKVNGIVADYDKDKTYWGFYVDGDYAMTGVDMTDIEEGKTYTFKVSK